MVRMVEFKKWDLIGDDELTKLKEIGAGMRTPPGPGEAPLALQLGKWIWFMAATEEERRLAIARGEPGPRLQLGVEFGNWSDEDLGRSLVAAWFLVDKSQGVLKVFAISLLATVSAESALRLEHHIGAGLGI